jgi:hypothetical protein
MNTPYSLTVLCFFVFAFAKAQLTGTIKDQKGEPVPYASIFIKDTYTGTTSNDLGIYTLKLPKFKTYEITFQSLGYKPQTISVDFRAEEQVQDVVLVEEVASLDEVVITNGEDPAYRVIRAAIAKRPENKRKTESFTADFYSRGLWRMEDVPEKFMGTEIGDLEGSLDSVTRSGIIYLSETVSEIAYRAPDDFKERIIASKVSGDDNGFSLNSAESAEFNFYNNNIDLNNRIVSPIADYALGYYRYKLLGTFFDDNGFLINKIEVTSRRKNDNTFNGLIYIVEDQWTIYGLSLTTSGSNISVPVIDNLTFTQDFTYEPATKDWIKRSQNVEFSFGLFGFKGNGRFLANYSNYDFSPSFEEKTFGSEVLFFEREANKKDSLYWIKKRPVPLTQEETTEYIKKDSISAVRSDPKYKDSVDRVENKLKVLDPILGYTYRNSNKNYRFTYDGLANFGGFNTVQGYIIGSGVSYVKGFDEDYISALSVFSDFNYGFSDDRLRYTGQIAYRFNRTNRRTIFVRGGTEARQINTSQPISPVENTISSLFFERNFAKFFEADFGGVGYSEEIFNGVRLYADAFYERRQGLNNTTSQRIIKYSDVEYTPNNPLLLSGGRQEVISEHEIFKTQLNLTIRPGQKYQSYPDRKFNISNEAYPTIAVRYEGGLGGSSSNLNFHQFSASLWQGFDMGNVGHTSYYMNAGSFVDGDRISFVDYQHFNGNRLRYKLSALNPYGFGLLQYYDYSTNDSYAQFHLQHDFKGFILGKIPGLSNLNFDLILSGKALFTERNPYFEVSAGIDHIGIGKIRPLRVDYVYSINSVRSYGAFILGFDIPF